MQHRPSPSQLWRTFLTNQALDDALNTLAKMDERRSQVIELRFFGGLTVEETAVVLKVSPDTVMRDSRLAKAWLARELSSGARP
jgi:RNA polymerase sigma factor (sigma-70 family)